MSNSTKININSATVAILLCLNSITWFLPLSNGAVVVVAAFSVILYLIAGNRIPNKKVLCLVGFNLLFFLSMLFGASEHEQKYLLEFIAVGIISLSIMQSHIDKQKVYICVTFISVILCPLILKMDLSLMDPGNLMGLSYGILRLICPLLFLIIFVSTKKTIRLILLIPLILYLSMYIQFASRGAILSLLVFGALLLYIRYVRKKHTGVLLIFSASLILLVMFEPIIEFLSPFFSQFGIDVYAFDKIIRMMGDGDVTNGRESILQRGFSMGMESPLWGHGVAAYENRYNTGYVHNLFMQIFIEGGIILLIPYVYYICVAINYIITPANSNSERIFLAMLLSLSIVELMFSNYLWRDQVFWLFIGYTIKLKNKKKYLIAV